MENEKAMFIIDMPENCADCMFIGYSYDVHSNACLLLRKQIHESTAIYCERDEFCPLRPINLEDFAPAVNIEIKLEAEDLNNWRKP